MIQYGLVGRLAGPQELWGRERKDEMQNDEFTGTSA